MSESSGRPGSVTFSTPPGLPEDSDMRVRSVEPGILSPRETVARFGLTGAAAAAVRGPSVVATVDLRPPPTAPPPEAFRGAAGTAKVRVGTERLTSLIEL
jgi:hypothetical protein